MKMMIRKMNRIAITVFGALLALPVLGEDIDQTMDAAADGQVDIYNTAGSIKVIGWSRNSVNVTGELGDDVEELIFERDGDEILIKVKVPRMHGRDIESDIEVRLPEGSSIDVSGVSADIDVSMVAGEQSLQTVSGDVHAVDVAADLEAASVSGDVHVIGTGANAETSVAAVSGDLMISGVKGEVEAESVSGDVEVSDGAFDRAYFETVNGDVSFAAKLRKGGKLSAESVNGGIDLEFDGEVSASFDIETFNGSIRNCFGPEAQRTSRYTPGLELSFTEGDGDGRVVVETLNGSIDICTK
jgi:DUF4097 and DUF4098 domain-containing protein YvlB